MILLLAAALAAAAPPPRPARLPRCRDRAEAFVCRALEAQPGRQAPRPRPPPSSRRRWRPTTSDPAKARMLAAAGNMWIAAGQPGKAARGARPGAGRHRRCRPSSAAKPCSTAPAPPKRRTTSRPRAPRSTEAARAISRRSLLLVFLGRAGDPRARQGDRANRRSTSALSLAPSDPTILFEAGHVAQFAGDDAKARDYWTRAAAADPDGPIGKAAQRRAGAACRRR